MGHRRQLTARALHEALGPLARAVAPGDGSLEVSLAAQEAGRTTAAPLLRDRAMRAHAVAAAADDGVGFVAFLDGVQESRVVAYVGTVPIVHGRTGAVIRARVDRRLVTWGDGPRSDDALYLPTGGVPPAVIDALAATACPIVDTTDDTIGAEEAHPQQLLRRAVHLVQREREAQEQALAVAWCRASGGAPLYLDGGLPPSEEVLAGGGAIGVIKSHHTLYATGSALATVMSLGAGERSSIFVVETRWRAPVASWYLRLRAPGRRDPLWGLVRVEASLAALNGVLARAAEGGSAPADDPDLAADRISQWVAAESAPLSLPDARWDTMAYGIRDCEVYLRAALGRLAT